MQILVIDDEQDIRDTAKLLLEHFGHEVRTAKNGVDALALVPQWAPDAVLTDLSMPAMNGFVTARKLRASRDDRPMLILACSAHLQDAMVRDLAMAAGCDAWFAKPLDWDVVQETLSRFEADVMALVSA